MSSPRLIAVSHQARIRVHSENFNNNTNVSHIKVSVGYLKKHIKSYSIEMPGRASYHANISFISILENICARYDNDHDILIEKDISLLISICQLRYDATEETPENTLNSKIMETIMSETNIDAYVQPVISLYFQKEGA